MTDRNRDKRKRQDGTDIDPVRNLSEFVQSFPKSEEEPAEPAQPPTQTTTPAMAPAVVATQTPAPEFDYKSEAERLRQQLDQTKRDLETQKTNAQIEATARRVVAEVVPQPQPVPPKPEPEDPRLSQIDELWFSDNRKARELLDAVNDDKVNKRLGVEREKIKQEVFGEITSQNQKTQKEAQATQAAMAFNTAMQTLVSKGIQPDTDRVTALYSMLTRKPTPTAPNAYFTQGAILNADAIVGAWERTFGSPTPTPAPVAPVTPAPIAAAPPGSSRPAPAAAAPRQTGPQVHLSADEKRDLEHVAKALGHDPEKLMARRRARLANEKR